MRLENERESVNVEDRRGMGGLGRGVVGGGIGTVVVVLLALFLGVDPGVILSGGGPGPPAQPGPRTGGEAPAGDAGRRFVARVLATTEDVWQAGFREIGRTYQPPVLVLFAGATRSGCGFAQAQVGPFYCPPDRKVYIDLDFLADMQRRLGAQGDFAAAYVIAHEVGHHVQNLVGVLSRADQVRRGLPEAEGNALQVRVELQADCLAGVWARRAEEARGILERGDIEEGLNAAAAVGDDRLQMRSRGYAVPESFTHGTARQRVRWFRAGLDSGDMRACDTFAARLAL